MSFIGVNLSVVYKMIPHFRNLFVLGFSLFFGLVLPNWMNDNGDAIRTGSDILDQLITVLLKTRLG